MKLARSILVAFPPMLLLVLSGPSAATDLLVSAAAGLTNAFTDIGREFENAHSGTKVILRTYP